MDTPNRRRQLLLCLSGVPLLAAASAAAGKSLIGTPAVGETSLLPSPQALPGIPGPRGPRLPRGPRGPRGPRIPRGPRLPRP